MRRPALLALPLLASLALAAAEPAPKRPLTVDDIWSVVRVGAPAVSRDGAVAVYPRAVWDAEKNRLLSDLWLQPVAGGPGRRLTAHEAGESSPAISPDGARVAFVAKRDGDDEAQLYLLRLDGGEAERLTDLPSAPGSPRWTADGRRIVFAANVLGESLETTKSEVARRKKEEKTRVVATVSERRLVRYWDRWLEQDEWPHLFSFDLATRAVTDLTPGMRRLGRLEGGLAFDVAPDGSVVFAANSTEPPYRTLNTDLFLVPAGGGAPRNLTADNPAEDSSPVFSPDGRTIAYGREAKADGWPDRTRLALLDVASGKTKVLTEDWDRIPQDWVFTPDGRTLVFLAEDRARTHVWSLPVSDGTPKVVWKGGRANALEVAGPAGLVFTYTTFRRPAELAAVKADGTGFRNLTSWNDALMTQIAFGEEREVVFKGAGGDDVQMFVVHPPGFEKGKKYPLLHVVHGGPIGTSGDEFHLRWNAHAFAAPGYVVALVNFHGSSSFGQAFVESILSAPGDKPFQDVMAATDFLIAEGSVDPKRIAAAGGSYGGYLVNWIAGQTDRFAALVSHAGIYSLLGQFASDYAYGRQHSYGAYPFTNPSAIERWSPNRYAANLKTPMLVVHGEKDYRVPITQGLELYGVLTAKGVPARLVAYPDENHWVLKGTNAKHWYGEVLGWLARWLK
ncbi:MAG: alpha/beta hydrolase family protein [Thermoanaerobaculia bacterium]